jgi:hypothetical protein
MPNTQSNTARALSTNIQLSTLPYPNKKQKHEESHLHLHIHNYLSQCRPVVQRGVSNHHQSIRSSPSSFPVGLPDIDANSIVNFHVQRVSTPIVLAGPLAVSQSCTQPRIKTTNLTPPKNTILISSYQSHHSIIITPPPTKPHAHTPHPPTNNHPTLLTCRCKCAS